MLGDCEKGTEPDRPAEPAVIAIEKRLKMLMEKAVSLWNSLHTRSAVCGSK